MDELTELMATSGDISSSTGSTQSLSFRSTQYKVKSGFDQRKRRDKLLELQKRLSLRAHTSCKNFYLHYFKKLVFHCSILYC